MNSKVKLLLTCLTCIAVAMMNSCKVTPPKRDLPGLQAKPANAFLNSIGVNSSISKRGEILAKTAEALTYTGIRWIRTGYEGDIPVADLIALHKQTGVQYSYGLLSGGTDIQRLLKGGRQLADNNSLLAFEGPNEPNNWGVKYEGEQGGRNSSWMAVARLQATLYSNVKADAVLQKYPVWSLSENGAQTDNVGLQYLIIPTGTNALMPAGTRYADYANCHNYITHPSWPGLHDNQVWNAASPGADSKVDGLYGNYGRTWLKKFEGYSEKDLQTLPRVTTETGLTIGDGVTEEQHALLLLNMYLAQFKQGCSYTAVYLLRDRSDETGNQQFGFYTTGYTPRKAATYLHNLTTILADKMAGQAGSLAYAITNQSTTVHDLLLQKSNGMFELIVWNEKLNGTDDIEVNFGTTHHTIKVYDPTIATTPVQTFNNTGNVKLSMSNHPFIIEIAKQ